MATAAFIIGKTQVGKADGVFDGLSVPSFDSSFASSLFVDMLSSKVGVLIVIVVGTCVGCSEGDTDEWVIDVGVIDDETSVEGSTVGDED